MRQGLVVIALGIVLIAALYLIALGGSALTRPELARRFLGGFATTRRLHFTELALRVCVGGAFIIAAPRLAFGGVLLLFGWVLITTSVGLALVPWRLHQRFAAWSVPRATRHLTLIGVASLLGGVGVVAAIIIPRVAVKRCLLLSGALSSAGYARSFDLGTCSRGQRLAGLQRSVKWPSTGEA